MHDCPIPLAKDRDSVEPMTRPNRCRWVGSGLAKDCPSSSAWGFVPPKQTGLPAFRISRPSHEFASTGIWPIKATMSGCAASSEKASTAPGLVCLVVFGDQFDQFTERARRIC